MVQINGSTESGSYNTDDQMKFKTTTLKSSGSLWKYHWDEPNDNITHFESSKF